MWDIWSREGQDVLKGRISFTDCCSKLFTVGLNKFAACSVVIFRNCVNAGFSVTKMFSQLVALSVSFQKIYQDLNLHLEMFWFSVTVVIFRWSTKESAVPKLYIPVTTTTTLVSSK